MSLQTTRISLRTYVGVVALTGSLAVAQFYFLPNNLGIRGFGMVALGLSVIQAALQFGDLGAINASLRTDVDPDLRAALREQAVEISTLACLAGIAVSCVFGVAGVPLGYVCAAAFASALLVVGGRAHASAAAQRGDEQSSTRHNIVWQNAPKLGSIAGSFGGSALASMLGAVASATLFGRPGMPPRPRWELWRDTRRYWLPGLAVSGTAFAMSWADTYALSALAGLDEAGQYQAIVRPLTGITYLYLPVVALIQAAHNAAAQRRERLLTMAGVGAGALGAVLVAAFLLGFGHRIWPDFRFDPAVVAAASVAAVAMCVATVVGVQLILRGMQVIASAIAIVGAIVLLAVSLGTVGSLGALGAGLAAAVAWTGVAAANGLALVRRDDRRGTQ
ncbi:hypothetical protein [Nocardia crassostreae]|uniref:hypothetical protein n=1 Tax=Nocardia crassostreae TaxID=53428 RepID=UPI00082B6C08|nr:hypothetical protein [Nocardia crassostreae]